MSDEEIRFTVLGPVRAWRGTVEVDIGPAKVRAVLASLLLRRGGRATAGQLIDDLWGGDPPASAEALIRTYIHRLRKGFGPTDAARVQATGGGYALAFDAARLDLTIFEQLVAEARAAHTAGDPRCAADLYRRGLALWTGAPAAGLPGPFAAGQRTRLDTLRITALEGQLACAVEAGNHAEAAFELAALIAEHPLHERFRELHMIALHGAGRQGEALAVFREADRLLRAELGVGPTPALRETHRRLLAGELTVRPPQPDEPSHPAHRITPVQLPAPLSRFIGRKDALTRLTAAKPMNTYVVHGMAGVGKTILAVQAAHLLKSRFPDGQLYVDLRGFDEVAALTPAEVLHDFLGALGVTAEQIPAATAARSALYRSMLAGRRMLVLLDNARDTDQVRPLLPAAPHSLTLVTSRDRLSALASTHHTHHLRLDPFNPSEARDYLARALGAHRVDDQRDAAGQIVEACAGLPLALSIVAARAAHLPDARLAEISAPLRTAHDRLDTLALGNDPCANARTAFSWSYQALEPQSGQLFRLLSLHPGPQVAPNAAAALTGLPAEHVRALLRELCRVGLLRERAADRFTCHDLLHLYGDELSRECDSAADRAQAVDRLLDYYVFSAQAADRFLATGPRRQIVPVPQRRTNVPAEQFADARHALDWLAAEYTVLIAAVKWAADHGAGAAAWRLGWFLNALPTDVLTRGQDVERGGLGVP